MLTFLTVWRPCSGKCLKKAKENRDINATVQIAKYNNPLLIKGHKPRSSYYVLLQYQILRHALKLPRFPLFFVTNVDFIILNFLSQHIEAIHPFGLTIIVFVEFGYSRYFGYFSAFLAFCLDIICNQFFGEHTAFGQISMICFQSIQSFVKACRKSF